jgi:hypothetical protein
MSILVYIVAGLFWLVLASIFLIPIGVFIHLLFYAQ